MSVAQYSLILIGLALFNAGVTTALAIAAWRKRWPALVERALASLSIAGGVCLAALLGWNLLVGWGWTAEQRLAVLFLALAVPSVANAVWLIALLSGKFNGESGQ